MKKLMSIIGAMAILASSSFAQDKTESTAPEKSRMEMKEKRHQGFMADIPNLTDEQKEQMKAIKEEGKKQLEPMRKEIKEIRNKMVELKSAEKPDEKQLLLLIDKSSSIHAEMEKVRTKGELKFLSILTPEQRKVVDVKMKEQQEFREKRHMERKEMKHSK